MKRIEDTFAYQMEQFHKAMRDVRAAIAEEVACHLIYWWPIDEWRPRFWIHLECVIPIFELAGGWSNVAKRRWRFRVHLFGIGIDASIGKKNEKRVCAGCGREFDETP